MTLLAAFKKSQKKVDTRPLLWDSRATHRTYNTHKHMRTKALLLTAALGAAGIATSMAQVYSVNAVGYINVTCTPGFNLVADQLVVADRTVGSLLATVPDGTAVYKFNGTIFDISTYDLSGIGGWDPDASMTIDHGSGVFIFNPTASPFTVTFVGDVAQGSLSTTVPQSFSVLSSKVPQSGGVSTVLQFPAVDGDAVYKYNGTAFDIFTYDLSGVGGWDPEEPTIGVGEAFFLFAPAPGHGAWSRNFTVN